MTEVKLTIDQGADFDQQLIWMNPDGVTPIDLTGWTGRGMIRQKYTDANPLAAFTVTLGGGAGTVDLSLDATATAALPAPSTLVWDVELISPTNKVTRLAGGKVEVTPEVTK